MWWREGVWFFRLLKKSKCYVYQLPVLVHGTGRCVDGSTLINTQPIAGRTDWKYPRHKTIPTPKGLVSSLVKNEFLFDGYLRLGSIRMTMFSAWLQ